MKNKQEDWKEIIKKELYWHRYSTDKRNILTNTILDSHNKGIDLAISKTEEHFKELGEDAYKAGHDQAQESMGITIKEARQETAKKIFERLDKQVHSNGYDDSDNPQSIIDADDYNEIKKEFIEDG